MNGSVDFHAIKPPATALGKRPLGRNPDRRHAGQALYRFDPRDHERKLATKNVEQIGSLTRAMINYLNSSEFIEFVE